MSSLVRNNSIIYFIATLFSLLLAYDGSLRATVINADGICYLQSAATMGVAGLHSAMQLCGQAQWPFYSALIFSVVYFTHLSYVHAAFVLNGILSLISVLAFIYIVRLLGGTRRVMWLATATILLMHEFNSVREYVIRDHGFWAFYLLSFAALIHYFRAPSWQNAWCWSLAMVAATLFRVEGIIFLLLIPCVTLFKKEKRWQSFWQLNSTILVGSLILFMSSVLMHVHLSRVDEIQFQFFHGITALSQHFSTMASILAQNILNGYSKQDARFILGLLLVSWYGFSVVTNLSLAYSVLVVFAWWQKLLKLDNPTRLVMAAYIVVNVLITAAFLVEYMFLSKRYLLALSLVLAFWVPFALDYLWSQQQRRPWLLPMVLGLVVMTALGGIIDFGYSKAYIRDAGLWLAKNAPAQASIYTNDYQVMYYSQHFGNDIFAKAGAFENLSAIANNQWQQYEYIALHVNPHDLNRAVWLKTIKLTPLKVFANKRGDEVVIYKKGE